MRQSFGAHPRVFTALLASAGIAFILIVVMLALPTKSKLVGLELQTQERAAEHAAKSLQLSVSALLSREWQSLGSFGELVNMKDISSARQIADAAGRASEGIYWAGIVGLDGIVLAGTDGKREGEDVSGRQWFLSGLHGTRIGNVYSAKMGLTDDPEGRLFNMSRPIVNQDGTPIGVAVYSMRFDWVADYLSNNTEALDVDLTLFDRAGDELVESNRLQLDQLPEKISSLADLGSARTRTGGANNTQYVAAILPSLVTGDLPEFGWSMVVRLPATPSESILGIAWNSLTSIGIGAFLIIGVVAYIFASHFLRPLVDLIETADAIPKGDSAFPIESDTSYEAAVLSIALARLQTNLQALAFSANGTQKRASD